jgi:hypothetical protein
MQSSLNTGSGVQWPNRIGSGTLDNPTIARWSIRRRSRHQETGIYGNSGRNILVGPRTTQFDVSVFKSFALSADNIRRVQFRAEAFNLANTPVQQPNSQINNLSVGQITSAASPRCSNAPPEIQLR